MGFGGGRGIGVNWIGLLSHAVSSLCCAVLITATHCATHTAPLQPTPPHHQDAERETGQAVSKAVISVPAYFDDGQREATIAAGRRFGVFICGSRSAGWLAGWLVFAAMQELNLRTYIVVITSELNHRPARWFGGREVDQGARSSGTSVWTRPGRGAGGVPPGGSVQVQFFSACLCCGLTGQKLLHSAPPLCTSTLHLHPSHPTTHAPHTTNHRRRSC